MELKVVSPETFVESGLRHDADIVPNSFHHLGTRQWERGAIVMYNVLATQQHPSPLAGHPLRMFMCQVIERNQHSANGWLPTGAGGFDDSNDHAQSEQMLQYAYGTSGRGPYAIVYGYKRSMQIHMVEAIFDNGNLLQDISNDGLFALLSPHDTFARELRAFSYHGQLLCQLTLPPPHKR
jgi:hypothetical protein